MALLCKLIKIAWKIMEEQEEGTGRTWKKNQLLLTNLAMMMRLRKEISEEKVA